MPRNVDYTTYDEKEYIKGLGKEALALGKIVYRNRRRMLLQNQLRANRRRSVWGNINEAKVNAFIMQQIAELG